MMDKVRRSVAKSQRKEKKHWVTSSFKGGLKEMSDAYLESKKYAKASTPLTTEKMGEMYKAAEESSGETFKELEALTVEKWTTTTTTSGFAEITYKGEPIVVPDRATVKQQSYDDIISNIKAATL